MNKTHKEYMNILEGLKDVQTPSLTREEAEAYLQEKGYNVEETVSTLLKTTKDELLKHTWKYTAEKNLNTMSATKMTSNWSNKTPDEIRIAFEAHKSNPEFAMAARNMESIGIEEMKAMLEDFDELEN
ncbi:MAG: hypothetical protein PF795_04690 [Kiritimatiellae bacterium]|jgi:hypothetical protein|nr:hypothetical protein [Kiritimatiellia bacterium]